MVTNIELRYSCCWQTRFLSFLNSTWYPLRFRHSHLLPDIWAATITEFRQLGSHPLLHAFYNTCKIVCASWPGPLYSDSVSILYTLAILPPWHACYPRENIFLSRLNQRFRFEALVSHLISSHLISFHHITSLKLGQLHNFMNNEESLKETRHTRKFSSRSRSYLLAILKKMRKNTGWEIVLLPLSLSNSVSRTKIEKSHLNAFDLGTGHSSSMLSNLFCYIPSPSTWHPDVVLVHIFIVLWLETYSFCFYSRGTKMYHASRTYLPEWSYLTFTLLSQNNSKIWLSHFLSLERFLAFHYGSCNCLQDISCTTS